jgi:hypothetical protein
MSPLITRKEPLPSLVKLDLACPLSIEKNKQLIFQNKNCSYNVTVRSFDDECQVFCSISEGKKSGRKSERFLRCLEARMKVLTYPNWGGASFQEHFVQLFFEAKQKGQGGQRRGRGRLMIQDQFAPASPPAGAQKWPHKNILYPLFFNGGGALLVPTRYRHCEAAPSFCLFLASRNNFLPCWFLSAPCNDFYRASDSRAHQTLNLGFLVGRNGT